MKLEDKFPLTMLVVNYVGNVLICFTALFLAVKIVKWIWYL